MNQNEKIIVIHPFKQHSFKTASALVESNNLYKYITSVYVKPGSFSTRILKILRRSYKEKLGYHRTENLNDKSIIQFCEIFGIVLLFTKRFININIINDLLTNIFIIRFNKKVARYVLKSNVDSIIVYDTLSWNLLNHLRKHNFRGRIIIDMSAPYFEYMHLIFTNDLDMHFKNNKKKKIPLKDRLMIKHSKIELALANYFIVASDFTAMSLRKYGIDKKNIYKCVYGIDIIDEFKFKEIKETKKLTVIFVGNVTFKKGIHYFFDSIKGLTKDKFEFIIIGNFDKKSKYLEKYLKNYSFTGHITKNRLVDYYLKSDIMIFPSICDGFGFSVLEAQMYGIPVICSENAGVSEMIIDGHNGFRVPAMNSEAIRDKLNWFNKNSGEITSMSRNSKIVASTYSWSNYNKCISNVISDILLVK